MISTVPQLTDSGKALLMRAIAGEVLTFTRMAIGSGELAEGQDQDELTALIHEELSITPTDLDDTQEGLIAISGDFNSEDVTQDFVWRELGIFAHGEDDVELLYAYANDGDDAGMLRAITTDILTEQTLTLIVEIDDAENVNVIFSPHAQYAEATVLVGHMNNRSNPHQVTKAQVGLGNVVNKAPNNITVDFTEATTRANISTGEKLSVLFGKIAKVITDAIAHITSRDNPHQVTKSQVGLGNAVNKAPSDMEITFDEADVSANMDENKDLFTGSTLATLFKRTGKAIHDALTHINTNTGNPHGVTKTDVGLGNVENTAPSFNVINFESRNTFAIPVTGETASVITSKVARDLTDLQTHMNTLTQPNPHGIHIGKLAAIGTYTGDGTKGRTIATEYDSNAFNPVCVMVWDEFGRTYNPTSGVCGGMATESRGVRAPNAGSTYATTWDNDNTALMCVTGGFKVSQSTGLTAEDSIDTNEIGVTYHYVAWK